MKAFSNFQKYAIYIFIFSLCFETMTILNIDFLASKISICILFISSLLNFKSLLVSKKLLKIALPLIAYFVLLSTCSYLNRDSTNNVFIDFLFFLNIVIFLILANYSLKNHDFLLKGLLVFAFSNALVTLLFFMGIGLSDSLEGRVSMLGMNENYLGIGLAIAFLTLLSIVIDNKLKLTKRRYLMLLLLPFLMVLIVKTGSRAAFLSVLTGLLLYVLLNKSVKFYQKVLLVIVTIITSILSFFIFLKDSFLVERLRDTIESGDTANRDLIWEALWNYFSDNFLFGVGKTGYNALLGELSPHNVLLEIFLYTGIVGLLIFFIFYYQVFKKAIYRLNYEKNALPFILLIPITMLLFTGQIFDKKVVWVILAYVSGYFPSKDISHHRSSPIKLQPGLNPDN